jgi:hypothetical protein
MTDNARHAQHVREQIKRWRETTPLQRLRWLEQTKRFAALAQAAADRRRSHR